MQCLATPARADHTENAPAGNPAAPVQAKSFLGTGKDIEKQVALLDRFREGKGEPSDVPALFKILSSEESWYCSSDGSVRNLHAEAAEHIRQLPKEARRAEMAALEGAAIGAWTRARKRAARGRA